MAYVLHIHMSHMRYGIRLYSHNDEHEPLTSTFHLTSTQRRILYLIIYMNVSFEIVCDCEVGLLLTRICALGYDFTPAP